MAQPAKTRVTHRNPVLVPGVHRFGRSKMYHKRGMFVKKTEQNVVQEKPDKKPQVVEKPVGGAQNGGKRLVQLKKSKRYFPTATGRTRKNVVKRPPTVHTNKLRASLKPGTLLILLAGRHAGKRVILLKQLESSGLLLVTGPFKLNGVPLRRIHQQYVIATSTLVDISSVKVPESINDFYFRRDKKAALKARLEQQDTIFASVKTRGCTPSSTRKIDQAGVDKQILNVIKSNPEKKMLCKYMSSSFSFKSGQYPHNMKF